MTKKVDDLDILVNCRQKIERGGETIRVCLSYKAAWLKISQPKDYCFYFNTKQILDILPREYKKVNYNLVTAMGKISDDIDKCEKQIRERIEAKTATHDYNDAVVVAYDMLNKDSICQEFLKISAMLRALQWPMKRSKSFEEFFKQQCG